MKNDLPRLTEKAVRKAERAGLVAGWYQLCRDGYLPEEIHVYSPTAWPYSEVRFKMREYARRMGLPVPANCAEKRQRVRRDPHVSDPAANFRTYVMRTGLALVLTKPMLEELCALACGCQSDRALYFREVGAAAPHNFIATCAALHKRGLIDDSRKLTAIGEALVELLKRASVFKEPDAALESKRA